MTARTRGAARSVVLVLVLLVLLAAAAVAFGGVFIPTIGIVTVGAGLFLTPLRTAIVAVVAVALGLGLLATQDIDNPALRFVNLTLASMLALLASWTIEQRIQGIERLTRTQNSVFTSVPDGLAVLGAQGVLVQSNDALMRLVPRAAHGERLHPVLDHVLADGSPCPGGCLLDVPAPSPAHGPVEGESIIRDGTRIWVEYTMASVDQTSVVVSLRDVSAIREAEQNRRIMLEAAVRQGEQEQMLSMLGAPEYASLPPIPGLQLDMYSVGGRPGEPTGGDLVDVSTLPDGRILVMVADALGEAVLSVRDAWKVLYVARAYVEAGVPLDEAIARTSATLAAEADPPDVSLAMVAIDPDTGRLEYMGGGHPPSLLVRANGATEWLESTASGVGQKPSSAGAPLTRQMLAADSLILYTDGVVDGAQDVIEGLSALRSSSAALRKRATTGWARTVTEAVRIPSQKSGSATLLLVRLDPASGTLQTSATL